MRQAIDQLKVWSAMKDQRRGIVDYDCLAGAGLAGSLVLNNILGRVLDSATEANRERVDEFDVDETQSRVELGWGDPTSYTPGGLMLSEGLSLSAFVGLTRAHSPAKAAALISYRLANEPDERWKVIGSIDSQPLISGEISAPFVDLERQIPWDFQRALNDPVKFVIASAEKALGMAEIEPLSLELRGITGLA